VQVKSEKDPKERPALVICLNGWKDTRHIREELKDDYIAELGLVLTKLDSRSLYPPNWEGRQTFTPETARKG
jgi:hypothetical protein